MGASETALRVGSGNFTTVSYTRAHGRWGNHNTKPHYRVELSSGLINSEGLATLAPLGKVDFWPVLDDHPSLLYPTRQVEGVHHDTALAETGYCLGNPVFFICTRQD
ncbi:unnamed protein product [Phytomonas sp. Hart1]|nr:unnamed protein product [Phytomonas sp. Hart1]|eukprot:CCW68259.1 unnamed protein product [Phytomonas sp. isolate Hart1]